MTDFAFIHGGGQGSWVWDATIAALEAQRGEAPERYLALDVPGCGLKRGRETDALSLDDVARDLIEDIERAGLARVALVGHSQGGQVMSRMVALRPVLFARLIYIACSIPLPGQSVVEMMGAGMHGANENEIGWPMDRSSMALAEQWEMLFCNDMSTDERRDFIGRLGQDVWPRATYAFRDWTYDHLDAVAPTFVLCVQDQILPARWQEVFAARFRVERIARIDAGHQAMWTQPRALSEILRSELAPPR